ncbi:MAG TPA: sucrase ferredoxin [Acidimicrobiales bacterium]|nr:sucrase ferredoxin [Acidimicrobiales bacterium]
MSSHLDTATTLRCSEWTHQHHVDPIGTAGTYAGYLLVEWPLPWPHDLSEVPELAPLVSALAGTGIRLQGLVATFPHGPERHAILYHRPPHASKGFAQFERSERTSPLADLVTSALELLEGRGTSADHAPSGPTDILICGHGRRDRCCGALGTSLALEMAAGEIGGDDTRLWRTSHTGGPRFAPTMIVLPEATVWAFADADMVDRIVRREGTLDDLVPRYRGCSGLSSPGVQALERAVLAETGWPLLSSLRRGSEHPDGSVSLTAQGPAFSATWEATVRTGRLLPVPVCGRPIDEATKSELELIVDGVRRIDPA